MGLRAWGYPAAFSVVLGWVVPRLPCTCQHLCAARCGSSVPPSGSLGGPHAKGSLSIPLHPWGAGCAHPVEAGSGAGSRAGSGRRALPTPAAPAAAGFPLLPLSLSSFQSRQAADFPANLKAQSRWAGGIKAGEMGQRGSHSEGGEAAPWDQSPAQQPCSRASHPRQHRQATLHQGFSGSGPKRSSLSSTASCIAVPSPHLAR